jgi:peroxiredoxin
VKAKRFNSSSLMFENSLTPTARHKIDLKPQAVVLYFYPRALTGQPYGVECRDVKTSTLETPVFCQQLLGNVSDIRSL